MAAVDPALADAGLQNLERVWRIALDEQAELAQRRDALRAEIELIRRQLDELGALERSVRSRIGEIVAQIQARRASIARGGVGPGE